MNSKELSEEVKDALKYSILCEHTIKIPLMMYFRTESHCLENQIQALERNVPLHKELHNDLYKQESTKIPYAKLVAYTLNSLQL